MSAIARRCTVAPPAPEESPPGDATLDRVLESVIGNGHDVLLSPESMANVRQLARTLPAALGRWSYLECRLTDSTAVDLVLLADRPAAQVLLAWIDASGHSSPYASVAWRATSRFLRAWVNAAVWWSAAVDHIWLEFDTGSGSTLDPGIFVCFSERRPAEYDGTRQRAVVEAVSQALIGASHRQLHEPLHAFFRALPDAAYVPYIGSMLQRASPTLRACVIGLTNAAIPDLLARAGGSCAALHRDRLRAMLPAFSRARDPGPTNEATMLHVDIGSAGLDHRVGIEFGSRREPQLRGTLPDRDFRTELVALGFCTRDKAQALAAWPGRGLALLGDAGRVHRTVRLVNHCKLVLSGAAAPEVKAYLALTHWAMRADAPLPLLNGSNHGRHTTRPS